MLNACSWIELPLLVLFTLWQLWSQPSQNWFCPKRLTFLQHAEKVKIKTQCWRYCFKMWGWVSFQFRLLLCYWQQTWLDLENTVKCHGWPNGFLWSLFVDCFYAALFSAFKQTNSALVAWDSEWVIITFYSTFWIYAEVLYLQCCLVVTWLVPLTWHCCCLGTHSVYTVQPRISLQCYFIQSRICRVHVCLAVTCHLHFWQNDWALLSASAVTQIAK